MVSKRYKKNPWVFTFVLLFLFVGLVTIFWAIQKYSYDVRSRAGSQKVNHVPVCPGPGGRDNPRCHARVVADAGGKPKGSTVPLGYGPLQLRGAYQVSGRALSGNPIIAIITAFDNPNVKGDLDKYSRQYGLPVLPNCSGSIAASTIPCFKKINQTGGTQYPTVQKSWAREAALDTQIVHAMCENCRILLVEATTNSYDNLLAAIDQARTQGAKIISNSWGTQEFSGQSAFNSHFVQPGYVYTFSAGDSGYGVAYPAASPNVTAVGGTSLTVTQSNSYGGESVWAGTGSGCSIYETKPSYQNDTGCAKRMVADVSAVADPNTGVAIYDSTNAVGRQSWFVYGGTSVASPLIAAMYGLAGEVGQTQNGAQTPYTLSSAGNLHDITTGTNGSCGSLYYCSAMVGYDGPSGLGTPNGFGAF